MAIPILLAKKYQNQDPKGWWMSEKLDGVRAIWNGKSLLSRNGKLFHAPDWFLEGLPDDVWLDGELWAGHNNFDEASGIARSKSSNTKWQHLIYFVFDCPKIEAPFEERFDFLQELVATLPPHIRAVPHIQCEGMDHLDSFFQEIIENRGEGVMLRQPLSRYEGRRSNTLLKYKPEDDMDATVIDYYPHVQDSNLVGSLVCTPVNGGPSFAVGSGLTIHNRQNPPPIGSRIIVKFQEMTRRGVPRFPRFAGIRAD